MSSTVSVSKNLSPWLFSNYDYQLLILLDRDLPVVTVKKVRNTEVSEMPTIMASAERPPR